MGFSAMEDLVQKINDEQESFEKMCTDLNSLVDSLEGQWQGSAQKEFAASYSKLKPKLEKICSVLSRYSSAIKEAASREEETDTSTAKIFTPVGPTF